MRDKDAAPALACPVLRHPHPAGAFVVLFAAPVPVELQLDPPVFVGMDDLARWSDDSCRLRSLHYRPMRAAGRPKLRCGWEGLKCIVIARRADIGGDVSIIAGSVHDPPEHVFLLFLRLEVV